MGAAPVALARSTPAGRMLNTGYQTLVTIKSDPNIEFSEIGVTPPSIMGDDEVETTTQHNTTWRTFAPRTLMTLGEFQVRARYDPVIYSSIPVVVNLNTTITITFPDGCTLAFYGFVKGVEFDEMVEGTPPECTVTIKPTNQDPTDCTEQAPVYTADVGTGSC